ncbi:hypothetical protein [Serratia rubidaea]|uniref:hypothetical protein n=1 Tax=Serratia rubidaea TaxID=61652 RepID=UPI001BAEC117|nr:hypothetical protein [Serratia rubidaea]MBS0973256.1 hypothetical protein [Serratia rubidaea]MDC6110787.1 hypothetical protein [Serratia rubidaea]
MRKTALAFALPLLLFIKMTSASTDCASLESAINADNRQTYQQLVQGALTEKVQLATIGITKVLAEDKWLAVFATTEIADPGVFFFNDHKFVDVWGGMVEAQEQRTVTRWAHALHIPDRLTQCFFQAIVIN